MITEYTREELVENAARYKSLSKWAQGDPTTYNQARILGIQRTISDELGWKINKCPKWDFESLLEDARQYESRVDWATHDMTTYDAAVMKGHIDSIVEELGWE